MTDNQRLARVLGLLSRVAAKGPLPEKVYLAVVSIGGYLRFGEVTSLQTSELLATEAARLAGVPVTPWTLADWNKKNGLPEEHEPVIVTARTPDGGLYTGPAWLLEVEPPDDGSEAPPEYAAMFHDGPDTGFEVIEVIAWTRDWPEPYRPEETTDEQA